MTLHSFGPLSPVAACWHVNAIAASLRSADAQELRSASGLGADEALRRSVEGSDKLWLLWAGAKPVFVCGVAGLPTIPEVGIVWGVGANAIEHHPKAFTRACMKITAEMHKTFPVLMNWVDERNTVHVKWLEWMGYEMKESTNLFSKDGTSFRRFIRVAGHV